MVDEILIELKKPIDAMRALSFFHWSSQQNNFEHSIRSYCIIIQILIHAHMFKHAQAMLESVIRRNCESSDSRFVIVESLLSTYKITDSSPSSFDLLIQTYSKLRLFELAFDVCCFLDGHGFSSSIISFNKLIYVVQKSDKNSFVWKIYEFMLVRRIYPNAVTTRIMIDAMCKEGTLKKFIDILDRIHGKKCTPMIVINTALVFQILEERRVEEGIVLLKRMLVKEMILDDIVCSLIVFAHYKNGDLESACHSYEVMLKRGHCANSFLYTLFIGFHCKERKIEEANHLMQEMLVMSLKPYDETYNFLIEGFSEVGRLEESLSFSEQMVERGFLPSSFAFNVMLRKLCETGDVRKANNIFTTLLEKGFIPNEATYAYLIDGYGKEGDAQEVLKLYYEMEYKGHKPGLMGFTSLIRSLCQCRKLEEAEKYLTVMKDRSLSPTAHIYNTLIAGQCEKGNTERALCHYDEMIRNELKPSSHTFAVLVEKFFSVGTFPNASIHLDSLKSYLFAILPEYVLYTQLLDLESRIDAALARKRTDIEQSVRNPQFIQQKLCIYAFNTFSNQIRRVSEKQSAEAPSWTLKIIGRILEDELDSDPTETMPRPS
ncbi:pentatricopeptide repeat-containing protein, mitochondrial [Cinnamomum micranthum f. kanehirae]|uniref:Pentatricopeptide repeat-containing protein, mitochondrial n=1 Tax=Cinnamomum micranthum f. kanehirae TaxID=337451 RepID=A0A3S4P8J7_9MAGN|nr:pentatricopeptide repeat-containing protein, mitochondrial [Cinnamomum micranthum f. kanehirae]